MSFDGPKQDQLLTLAWEQIEQLLNNGEMRLPNGKVYKPEDGASFKAYCSAVRGLLRYKPPKKKIVPTIEDLTLQKTS